MVGRRGRPGEHGLGGEPSADQRLGIPSPWSGFTSRPRRDEEHAPARAVPTMPIFNQPPRRRVGARHDRAARTAQTSTNTASDRAARPAAARSSTPTPRPTLARPPRPGKGHPYPGKPRQRPAPTTRSWAAPRVRRVAAHANPTAPGASTSPANSRRGWCAVGADHDAGPDLLAARQHEAVEPGVAGSGLPAGGARDPSGVGSAAECTVGSRRGSARA